MSNIHKRGFASLSPERRSEIASKGGKAAQAKGTGHRFTKEDAGFYGRQGGQRAQALGKAHKFTSVTAVEAGRKGGKARVKRRKPRIIKQVKI